MCKNINVEIGTFLVNTQFSLRYFSMDWSLAGKKLSKRYIHFNYNSFLVYDFFSSKSVHYKWISESIK